MALVFDGMPCGLCCAAIRNGESLFATSGVWLPASDQLAQYCDAVFHWNCYAKWTYRHQFARSYFNFWIEEEKSNPYWWRSYLDESVSVTVNRATQDFQACVVLAETGSRLMVPLRDWESWLADPESGDHIVEIEAFRSAKASLRDQRPTADSLLESIDDSSKDRLFRQMAEDERAQLVESARRQKDIEDHNRLCEQTMPIIVKSGYCCPTCKESGNFRLSALDGKKSLIICRKCGETIDPLVLASAHATEEARSGKTN